MPQTDDDVYLSMISEKDRSWDEHRRMVELVINAYGVAGAHQLVRRLCECSNQLIFNLSENEDSSLSLRLSSARFCRVRYCPVCQWRRSLMWRARFISVLPQILNDHPNTRWLFLTLTVKNVPVTELREQIKEMNLAWSRLVKRVQFPGLGWVRTLEVTRGKDGSAHPHFHVLLQVPASYFGKSYVKFETWVELWRDCLRADYPPVIYIRAVNRSKAQVEATQQELMKGICETLKYSVKESDLIADPAWLGEVTRQMHNVRAIAIGGTLKPYLSEQEPENLIDGEVEEEEPGQTHAKIAFDWDNTKKRFRMSRTPTVVEV